MFAKLRQIIERFPLPALFVVFLLAELIIDPVGNFPLNDDWWYADSYKKLFEENQGQRIPWGASSLVGQLALTKPYAMIFGYSYTALRFFTLILSFSFIIVLFKIFCRHLKVPTIQAFGLSLVFMIGPFFLALSNSYMTDVPFLFFITGGFYFYLNYKESRSFYQLFASSIFFIFAITTRQLALAFLAGILISEFIVHRKVLPGTVIIFVLPALVLFCFEFWIQSKINNSIYTYVFFRHLPILNKIPMLDVLINLCKRWVHFITYAGLVLFPLLIPYLYSYFKNSGFTFFRKEFLVAAVVYMPVIISLNKFPLGNYLFDLGIGPDTLYDAFSPDQGKKLSSPYFFLVLKLIAYLSSFSLLLALSNFLFSAFPDLKQTTVRQNHLTIICLTCVLVYYIAMCFTSAIFDRYTLPFTLLVMILLHEQFKVQLAGSFSRVLIAVLFAFSTLGIKDYLSSNRTRWEVVNTLKVVHKATDETINAGYEHEGASFPNSEAWYGKWLNTPPNLYLVSRLHVSGYSVIGFKCYQRYLPPQKDSIFYLKLDPIPNK